MPVISTLETGLSGHKHAILKRDQETANANARIKQLKEKYYERSTSSI